MLTALPGALARSDAASDPPSPAKTAPSKVLARLTPIQPTRTPRCILPRRRPPRPRPRPKDTTVTPPQCLRAQPAASRPPALSCAAGRPLLNTSLLGTSGSDQHETRPKLLGEPSPPKPSPPTRAEFLVMIPFTAQPPSCTTCTPTICPPSRQSPMLPPSSSQAMRRACRRRVAQQAP